MTLTDIVAELEPRLLETLSSITVVLVPDGAQADLSFALFTSSTRRVDTDNLPDGIGVTGWERWPNLIRDLDTTPGLREQIRDLDRSGLVGRLDSAPARGRRGTRWHIKTHAGSQQERDAWMLRLAGRAR